MIDSTNIRDLFGINHFSSIYKTYQLIDKTYQHTNNMFHNIRIRNILSNFATSTLQNKKYKSITTHKNEAI